MRELTDERAEQALKEYAKEAINEVLIKYYLDGSPKVLNNIALEVINNLK
jgi:hypothetical protein